jgi:hypothetical protein
MAKHNEDAVNAIAHIAVTKTMSLMFSAWFRRQGMVQITGNSVRLQWKHSAETFLPVSDPFPVYTPKLLRPAAKGCTTLRLTAAKARRLAGGVHDPYNSQCRCPDW